MSDLRLISPPLDHASLTAAHVALCQVEAELRTAGRQGAADAIAYADLVILTVRGALSRSALNIHASRKGP